VVLAASPETMPGAPRSIAIWTPESYDSYTSAALAGLSPISPKARDLKRFFFNYSHDTELDSAHRVMIPTPLMEYADLDKDVVVTGSGECLEVWDRAKYAGYSEDVLIRVPDIAASLGDTT
jgi:MraZ protein